MIVERFEGELQKLADYFKKSLSKIVVDGSEDVRNLQKKFAKDKSD